MKLSEALRIINEADARPEQVDVYLACGFTPMHLRTFIAAHLQRQTSSARIAVETGVFDDLPGNIKRMELSGSELGICVVEWPDLDPRLGVRRISSWSHRDYADIEKNTHAAASRLEAALLRVAKSKRVIVVLPTLPLLPVAFTGSAQMSSLEAALCQTIANLAFGLAGQMGIAVVRNDSIACVQSAFDIESEIASGFPYTLTHAAAVAGAIANKRLYF